MILFRNVIQCAIIIPLFLTLFQCSTSHKLSSHVTVNPGAINGVFIEKNGKTLVVYGDPENEIKNADMVLFTHSRRDVVWAGRQLVLNGAKALVPKGERFYFTRPDSFWTTFTQKRFHDYYQETTKIPLQPLKVFRSVQGGDILKWQDLDIKVLDTPGYTRDAVSYIVNIDEKKIAFTGDLIYGDGKILDLYSFQDAIPEAKLRGYHGYAARLGQLIKSLQLVTEEKPDILIPSRGPIIENPELAIQKLIERIRLAYDNYLSISAIRWHFGQERFDIQSNRVLDSKTKNKLTFAQVIEEHPPSWYKHIYNTNLVFSDDGSAFLIDCGTEGALKKMLEWKKSGRLKSLDGLFITHYHDDHTDKINEVVKEFGCPVYVTLELKDILEHPAAYRVPCLTTESISNLTIVEDGQKMRWKDFTLTFHFFPGQTLYHDAVLFEKDKEAVFFIGDSFTPSGIDDYCLQNRNLLHSGMGYLLCLDVLKKYPETVLLSNQHMKQLFSFSREQLDIMTEVLQARTSLFKDLFPWDNPNYGVDERWIEFYPYGQKAKPGDTIELTATIFNHSSDQKNYEVKLNLPAGFKADEIISSVQVKPLTEGKMIF